MPAPAVIALGIYTTLEVIDLALSYYDRTQPDPLQDEIDLANRRLADLGDKLDEIDANFSEMGEELLRELSITRDAAISAEINSAVADVRAARAQLQRIARTEDPSDTQVLDTINLAENALFGVLEQSELKLAGDTPLGALGFMTAVSFAVGVRLEVAARLEDGAVGATSIHDSLRDAAQVLRDIEARALQQLEDQIVITGFIASESDIGARRRFIVSVRGESEATDTSEFTNISVYRPISFIVPYDRDAIIAQGVDLAGPGLREDMAAADYETLNFGSLLDAATGYEELSDGEDIPGSSGSDSLEGTDGNDLISGLGGNDRLYGRGDDDVIRAGSGNDSLFGGGGKDFLDGQENADMIRGGGGADGLVGGTGNDKLYGQRGSDQLVGNEGKDRLDGNGGGDLLSGGRGSDRLFGGAGKDELRGGQNNDVLTGGKGADQFVFDAPRQPGVDRITDFEARDSIVLDADVFAGLPTGDLPGNRFETDLSPDSNRATVLYVDGVLYYDADGARPGAATPLARLDGSPALDASDILIV